MKIAVNKEIKPINLGDITLYNILSSRDQDAFAFKYLQQQKNGVRYA